MEGSSSDAFVGTYCWPLLHGPMGLSMQPRMLIWARGYSVLGQGRRRCGRMEEMRPETSMVIVNL